jgi:hypothetical protein
MVEWVAEGLRLPEIKERAAKEDPPFDVDWNQIKWARQRLNVGIRKMREQEASEVLISGLPRMVERIRQLEALYDKHLALIIARGEEMAGEIAGGETGLLVRDYKGRNADVAVYKYDGALVKEMRGILDDIAREVGDRKTNVDLTTKGQPITFATLAQLATDGQSSTGENDTGAQSE